jgi:hypothetical protein
MPPNAAPMAEACAVSAEQMLNAPVVVVPGIGVGACSPTAPLTAPTN